MNKSARPTQILLIEDEAADIEFTQYAFDRGSMSHQLTVCMTGEAGIDHVRSTCGTADFPDLVLLDVNLPDMTGIDVVAAIRADAAPNVHLPVIMLSTSAYKPDVMKSYAAAANAYVQKPARLAGFESLVRSIELLVFPKQSCRRISKELDSHHGRSRLGGDVAASANQQREGHTLINTRGSSMLGCGAAGLCGALMLSVLAGSRGGGLFTVGAVVLAMIAGAALLIGLVERRNWGPLECVVPQWPLFLGETVEIELVRSTRRSNQNRTVQFSGELICQEKVTYQQGTTTVTDKHVVHRAPVSAAGKTEDGRFHAVLPLTIPVDSGAPTLALEHNEIVWRLQLELGGLSFLMTRVAFELEVAPVLFGSRPSIQDAPR